MTDTLTAADRRLLTAVKDRQVSYFTGQGGRPQYERYDTETGTYKKVSGSRMDGFVADGLVEKPTLRASGTAVLTAAGEAALND